ncbi:MAG: hypothetical protein KDC35_11890 [Acidobacteria bacterium]|nr:hypothetical protein [Acidobacteriota bacterium]
MDTYSQLNGIPSKPPFRRFIEAPEVTRWFEKMTVNSGVFMLAFIAMRTNMTIETFQDITWQDVSLQGWIGLILFLVLYQGLKGLHAPKLLAHYHHLARTDHELRREVEAAIRSVITLRVSLRECFPFTFGVLILTSMALAPFAWRLAPWHG